MTLPVKKAVFNIVTSFLIMGGYVWYVFGLNAEENMPFMDEAQFWGKFTLIMAGVTIGLKIILYILFSIVQKAQNEDEDIDFMDERDKLIEMKSDRNGNYFFVMGLMGAMIPLAMGESIQYFFIILLTSGFVAGNLGDLWKIYYYNKGV